MYNPQLDTFIGVADAGSFSKAAAHLFVSPTAVIKQINLLEDDLGVQLFVRTHRGITLTEAGKSLYQDTKHMIQYAKDALTRAKKAAGLMGNVIRIGSSPITPSHFLVELWPKIHSLLPDTKFELIPFENTPDNAREILANLGRNMDVVAGVFDDHALQTWGCAGIMLSQSPLCVAVPIHHPLAQKESLAVSDLFGENLMLIQRGWNGSVDALRDDMESNYPEIHVVNFTFYSLDVFNRCENEGNVLMALQPFGNTHPLLKVLPVQWAHTIPFGILYSPEPSEQVLTFIQAVAKVFEIEM